MAYTQSQPSKLFASDIAQYSDTELDQYLEVNGRCVRIDDPENLPDHFIQRLRARAGAGDTAQPRSIDLNYVSARLVEEPVDRITSPRLYSSASSTASIDEEEYYCRNLERETEYYNKLINDGGRPSHPISLGYDVAKNLEEYREILSFWNPSPDREYGWMVFGKQKGRWERFRETQRQMRTDGPFVDRDFVSRPAKPGRFAAYCRRLHDRLARHAFKRSFQLNEEPDRQDKLATWVEFLNSEYVAYDSLTNTIKRLQQQYDDAWKRLVDSKVLKPFETEKSFDYFFWLQQQSEEIVAKKAVESALSTVRSAENALLKAQPASLPEQKISQVELKLSVARSKLTTATNLLERFIRRDKLISDFMNQTKSYRIAKDDVVSQNILLRWILQQVPLIELELSSTEISEKDSTEVNDERHRSLKRNRNGDRSEQPVSKRQRQDGENYTLLRSKICASTVQEISSTQQPRQTQSSRTNSSILSSKPCSQRVLRASRPLNTKSDSATSGVVPDDSARVRKGRQRKKFSLDCRPDSRVLRRSSRLMRPPERFQ